MWEKIFGSKLNKTTKKIKNKNKNLQSPNTVAQINPNPTIYVKPLSSMCSWKGDNFRIYRWRLLSWLMFSIEVMQLDIFT